MKLTKIYTRTGDKGKTSLVGGERVEKDSLRLEAYGTVDELSSHLGLLDAMLSEEGAEWASEAQQEIEHIQCVLFNVCTFLATDCETTPIYPSARMEEQEVRWLEGRIDDINKMLPTLSSFILPGGCKASAQAHVCRTVCRRAERRVVSLFHSSFTSFYDDDETAESVVLARVMLSFINRISDYLFVLARYFNIMMGKNEKTWQNTCK